jgi:hypothetical protein
MGLLERWRCTIWGQAARSVQSPLGTQHLRTEVKWEGRGGGGGGGRREEGGWGWGGGEVKEQGCTC